MSRQNEFIGGYGCEGPRAGIGFKPNPLAYPEQLEGLQPNNPPASIIPPGKRELAREGARCCRMLAEYGGEVWALMADIVERALQQEADEAFDRR